MKTIFTISKSARGMILVAFLSVLSWAGAFAQSCNADFTFIINGGSASFTNTSTGAQAPMYSWNFGDGNYDWAKNPVHSYANKGTYTVCLFMYDSLTSCSDSICKTVVINVGCNPLSVAGNGKDPSGPSSCDGSVNISASGGVAPYVYTWTPNVSNAATANNLCGGFYDITVSDANGCTGITSVYIQDSSSTGNCSAGFTFLVNGASASFTNTSTGANTPSYFWDFGDGNYDYSSNPVHSFNNKGVYTVCLTMYDSLGNCSNTFCDSVVITTGCNLLSVIGNGTDPSNPSSCDGAINITSVSGGVAPYGYTWSPNVSNSASANNLCGGFYDITVTDANGCTGNTSVYLSDSSSTGGCSASVGLFQDSTNSNPLFWYAYANVTGTAPFTYLWNFGDGSTSTQQYPSHTYATAGHYAICLTITDATGCTSSSCDTTYKRTQGGMIKYLAVKSSATGVKENSLAVASIFPNPAKDMIEVSLSQFTQGELMITDIAGREIYREKINTNNIRVNVSNFPVGYYNLTIVSGDKVSHNKIMIAR